MDTEVPQLVFGDDGSAAADVVWLWVNNHRWPGWRISVVTAQPNQPGPPGAAEPSALRLWEPPEPRRLFVPDDVVQLEHLVAWADPRLMLDSCKEATLLAIGPRGTGELKRLHIGSTAEWLVSSHRPLTPVVIVRSARRVQRVLLCVDGSAHAQRAAQTLARLPWIGDCEITILGVRFGRAEAERGFEEAAAILHSTGIKLPRRRLKDTIPNIEASDVRSVILDTIAEEEPELVAMGTRGIGGLRRMLLGSTASAVVHHAPCSVLVAHARDTEIDH